MKRDSIFYTACGLCAVGLAFALAGSEFSLLFFVAAYLVRPLLVEFGKGGIRTDEREIRIHSRSGNLAFIILIVAIAGFAVMRLVQGKQPDELYLLLAVGLTARALIGPILNGEYRRTGMIIITAVGVFFGLFIVLETGFRAYSLAGLAIAALAAGFGQLARKFPRSAAGTIIAVCALAVVFFRMYDFRFLHMAMWLLFVTPLAFASACLLLGGGDEAGVSGRMRAVVFGSLSVAAVVIFALLLVSGAREKDRPLLTTSRLKTGETKIVQGIECSGSVAFYPGGELYSGILAHDDTISGHPLPEGTQVFLYKEGGIRLCAMPYNAPIRGYICRGEGPGQWTNAFHPNGQPSQIWLAHDELVQGVPCSAASFWNDVFGGGASVYFFRNGRIASCRLSQDWTFEGRSFKRGDHPLFTEDGHLQTQQR